MPHTMVTFRLHRSGVILLALFCVVLAVLIYVAGYLTGVSRGSRVARAELGGQSGKETALATRNPQPATAAATPKSQPATPASKESLTLRVAVLTSEEDAKAQVASLTAMGLKPSVVQMPTSSGVTLHNVVVGQFETRSAANAAAKELQSRLGFLPVVVPAPRPPNL